LKLDISEDLGSFGFGEFAPLAWGEVPGEMELADSDAYEAEGWKADAGGHFADLAVAAFVEDEFDPTGRDVLTEADGRIARGKVGVYTFGFGRECYFSFDDDTLAQFLQCIIRYPPFDLRPISAGMGVFWIEKFGV
jgi:hypothetical protein